MRTDAGRLELRFIVLTVRLRLHAISMAVAL